MSSMYSHSGADEDETSAGSSNSDASSSTYVSGPGQQDEEEDVPMGRMGGTPRMHEEGDADADADASDAQSSSKAPRRSGSSMQVKPIDDQWASSSVVLPATAKHRQSRQNVKLPAELDPRLLSRRRAATMQSLGGEGMIQRDIQQVVRASNQPKRIPLA